VALIPMPGDISEPAVNRSVSTRAVPERVIWRAKGKFAGRDTESVLSKAGRIRLEKLPKAYSGVRTGRTYDKGEGHDVAGSIWDALFRQRRTPGGNVIVRRGPAPKKPLAKKDYGYAGIEEHKSQQAVGNRRARSGRGYSALGGVAAGYGLAFGGVVAASAAKHTYGVLSEGRRMSGLKTFMERGKYGHTRTVSNTVGNRLKAAGKAGLNHPGGKLTAAGVGLMSYGTGKKIIGQNKADYHGREISRLRKERATVSKSLFNPFDGRTYEVGKASPLMALKPLAAKAKQAGAEATYKHPGLLGTQTRRRATGAGAVLGAGTLGGLHKGMPMVSTNGPIVNLRRVSTPSDLTGASHALKLKRISGKGTLPRHTTSLKRTGGGPLGAAAVGDGLSGARVRSPKFRGSHSGAVSA
jgi:hypothetical protein